MIHDEINVYKLRGRLLQLVGAKVHGGKQQEWWNFGNNALACQQHMSNIVTWYSNSRVFFLTHGFHSCHVIHAMVDPTCWLSLWHFSA